MSRVVAALAVLVLVAACQTQVVELRPADAAVPDAAGPDAAIACTCRQPCDSPTVCRDRPCTVDGVCEEAAATTCTAAAGCSAPFECRRADAPDQACP